MQDERASGVRRTALCSTEAAKRAYTHPGLCCSVRAGRKPDAARLGSCPSGWEQQRCGSTCAPLGGGRVWGRPGGGSRKACSVGDLLQGREGLFPTCVPARSPSRWTNRPEPWTGARVAAQEVTHRHPLRPRPGLPTVVPPPTGRTPHAPRLWAVPVTSLGHRSQPGGQRPGLPCACTAGGALQLGWRPGTWRSVPRGRRATH